MKTTMKCNKHPSVPLFYVGKGGFICKVCMPKVAEEVENRKAQASVIRKLNAIYRNEMGI